jgi:hypothetical protein
LNRADRLCIFILELSDRGGRPKVLTTGVGNWGKVRPQGITVDGQKETINVRIKARLNLPWKTEAAHIDKAAMQT